MVFELKRTQCLTWGYFYRMWPCTVVHFWFKFFLLYHLFPWQLGKPQKSSSVAVVPLWWSDTVLLKAAYVLSCKSEKKKSINLLFMSLLTSQMCDFADLLLSLSYMIVYEISWSSTDGQTNIINVKMTTWAVWSLNGCFSLLVDISTKTNNGSIEKKTGIVLSKQNNVSCSPILWLMKYHQIFTRKK